MENWLGDEKMARLLRVSKRKSATEMQEWQHKRFVSRRFSHSQFVG